MFSLAEFVPALNALQQRHTAEDFHAILSWARCGFSVSGDEQHVLYRLENKKYGREEKGLVVDIGAHHPFQYSNSYLFYLCGWRCINIEPNPEAAPLFQRFRPEDINLTVAVSVDGKPARYWLNRECARNSIHPLNDPKLYPDADPATKPYDSVMIETRTINDILTEHAGNKPIDFLTIDVEGLDYPILKTLDYSRFAPLMIDAELGVEEWYHTEIEEFFRSVGYEVLMPSGHNVLLKRKDF